MASQHVSQKILINARLYGAGGIETHLLNLCKVLIAHGAQITMVCRHANTSTPLVEMHKSLPLRLITTPFAADLQRWKLSTLWARMIWPLLLQRQSFDLLLTHESTRFLGFLAQYVKPQGRIVLFRAGEPLRTKLFFAHPVRPLLHSIIVETPLQADAIRQVQGSNLWVEAIPLLGLCQEPPTRNRNSDRNEFRVAFLGRYDKQKGVYRLLDIWPKLALSAARLDFYGHGTERHMMIDIIRKQDLESQVTVNQGWAGADELAGIMARTDLVVLPSETEGLPVVLLESMAYGVPFVATDVGAIRVLANDNPDVRVVPLDNVAIQKAVEEMYQKIHAGEVDGQRLQQYYRDRYSYSKLAERWTAALLYP